MQEKEGVIKVSAYIAFSNLRAEMARERITIGEIATALGKARNTVSGKLSRKYPLTLEEATIIKQKFFNDFEIAYLFAEALVDTEEKNTA